MIVRFLVLFTVVLCVPSFTLAADYVTTGTATRSDYMKWSNPHAWIYMDVEDESGNVVNWALESLSGNVLVRRGWRKADLPAGVVVSVVGWQARNATPTASIRFVTLSDGRKLFSGTGTATPATEE